MQQQALPDSFFPARGNLNQAIQTLGAACDDGKQVLLTNQQSSFQLQQLKELASPLQLRRTLQSRDASQRIGKSKKPHQPQMSVQQVRNRTVQEKAMAAATSIKFRK